VGSGVCGLSAGGPRHRAPPPGSEPHLRPAPLLRAAVGPSRPARASRARTGKRCPLAAWRGREEEVGRGPGRGLGDRGYAGDGGARWRVGSPRAQLVRPGSRRLTPTSEPGNGHPEAGRSEPGPELPLGLGTSSVRTTALRALAGGDAWFLRPAAGFGLRSQRLGDLACTRPGAGTRQALNRGAGLRTRSTGLIGLPGRGPGLGCVPGAVSPRCACWGGPARPPRPL
jgi:hypothetical protein